MSKKDIKTGFKKGYKLHEKIIRENKETMQIAQEQLEETTVVNEILYEVIDLISLPDEEKEEYKKYIREKRNQVKKPRQFKIKIVKNDLDVEDTNLVNHLRKALEKLGNSAHIKNYMEYKHLESDIVDYTIFIGDSDKIVDNSWKKIYDAFGCVISIKGGQIVAKYDKYYTISKCRNQFILYYKNTVECALKKGKYETEIEKLLKKREDNTKSKKISKLEEISIKTQKDMQEYFDDPDNFRFKHLPKMLYRVPYIYFRHLLVYIPLAFAEDVLMKPIRDLRDFSLDSKIVSKMLRNIILIKLVEFIHNEQIKHLKTE